MARNTINAEMTNDLGEYITAPVVRAVRPLPRRALGAQRPQPQNLWHSGTPVPATRNENSAGPSRSAHIPTTTFPFTIPPTPSSRPHNSHQPSSQRYQPQSPERTPTVVPHGQPLLPPSPLPRKKGLTIKLPYFLPRGKNTLANNNNPSTRLSTAAAIPNKFNSEGRRASIKASTSLKNGGANLESEIPIQPSTQTRMRTSPGPTTSPAKILSIKLRNFLPRPTTSSIAMGTIASSARRPAYPCQSNLHADSTLAEPQGPPANSVARTFLEAYQHAYPMRGVMDQLERKAGSGGRSRKERLSGTEEHSPFDIHTADEYSASASTLGSGLTNPDADDFFEGNPQTASSYSSTRPDSFEVGVRDEGEAFLPGDLEGMMITDEEEKGINEGSKHVEKGLDHRRTVVDARLHDHLNILPSHLKLHSSPTTPLQLVNSPTLLGKKLVFIKVRSLSEGNGTASLEVVGSDSGCQRAAKNIPNERLFVLKKFKAGRKDTSLKLQTESLVQLKRECDAYRRIAEAPTSSKRGLEFVMRLEATITILDGERNESWCLLMPLMPKDLAQLMAQSEEDLSIEDVRRILAQVCVGLATLHSIGIIHSDVKPTNILLDAQGNVKIADFGLSYTTESMVDLKVDGAYTKAKLGTMGYMAPEKVNGEKYSYPVDFWSVGWMLYGMVSVGKELVDAHDKESDLKEWAEEYGSLASRREFFEDEEFDDATLGLLCGLLDPNPQTRMGIEEIILHPFFISRGESEFSRMYEKAALRTTEEAVHKNVPLMATYVSEPSNGTTFRWINPYGRFA